MDPSLASPLLPRALAVTLACAITGCASFSTHLAPTPTAEGEIEFDGHLDVLALTEDANTRNVAPNVELGIRYGVSELADIGAKVGVGGGEVNSRVLVVRQPGINVAVVPGLGMWAADLTSGHAQNAVLGVSVPVIAGVEVAESFTLVVGPKALAHLGLVDAPQTRNGVSATYPGELVLYPGGVVGVLFRLKDRFALFPELNVLFPYLTKDGKFARPVFQGGVALRFGSNG